MWQRFTESARRVVFFSLEEAGRFGEDYVAPEHLLLGLVRENDCVAARVLQTMGISIGAIRLDIESNLQRGAGRSGPDMQLTPRAKQVIDLAYDEARRLHNNYIGTEHLLLGLIREAEGIAGRTFAKLSVDLERTRREVMELQGDESPVLQESGTPVVPTQTAASGGPAVKIDRTRTWQRFTERARRVVFYSQEEAGRLGANYVSTEHLLLGLVRDSECVGARLLVNMGVSLDEVRKYTLSQARRGEGRPGQDMQLTPRAKRVVDLANVDAFNLGNDYVGTEHILLGLIVEGEGLAARTLAKLGVDLESARQGALLLQDQARGAAGAAAAEPEGRAANRLRFTGMACRVMFLAEKEAAQLGEGRVSTEHILLALVRDSDCAGAVVLERMGASLQSLRSAIQPQAQRREIRAAQDMPLTAGAQHAVDISYEEARQLSHDYVGTEHLLLGLIRSEGLAAVVLGQHGVALEPARGEVAALRKTA